MEGLITKSDNSSPNWVSHLYEGIRRIGQPSDRNNSYPNHNRAIAPKLGSVQLTGKVRVAIASAPAKLMVSQRKRPEYEAPLRKESAACVGQAKSDNHRAYNFQFRNGQVYCRLDMSWADASIQILYI